MFYENKLRGKMAEKNITFDKLASILGINYATLYRKTKGESEFTRCEIQQISNALSLSWQEVKDIFFGEELAET